jgi:hypothetical protein
MVLFAVVVVLLVGVGVGRPAVPDEPLILTGEIHVSTAPDGRTTVVTMDGGDPASSPDGVTDHAFRVQHESTQALEYEGPATIHYLKGQLTVQPRDRDPWVFVVAGGPIAAAAIEPSRWVSLITVMGLSHHWGTTVDQAPEEVSAGLLSGACSVDGGSAPCENCEAGGGQSCEVTCGGGNGCSASCQPNLLACCSCPNDCNCCDPREAEAAKRVGK